MPSVPADIHTQKPLVRCTRISYSALLYLSCSSLAGQSLEGTTSPGERAVLCLFLMSLPALRHERHQAEGAGEAVPHQAHSNKVPWAAPDPLSHPSQKSVFNQGNSHHIQNSRSNFREDLQAA